MLISLFLLFSFPRRLNFLVSDTFLLYTLPFGLMTILLWEISIWLCCAFLLTSFEIKTNIKSVREDEALFHHMKKRLMLMVVCILYLYVYVRLCIDFFMCLTSTSTVCTLFDFVCTCGKSRVPLAIAYLSCYNIHKAYIRIIFLNLNPQHVKIFHFDQNT